MAARLNSSQVTLTENWQEEKPRKPGCLAAPEAVLDGALSTVADLQELGRAVAGVRGAGEEDLVPQTLVTVEQGELGAGVRAFAARDDAVPAG
ncbi:hypothetical protein [Streptomyces sp. NPDC056227]|uniref:hypothetical protein n=1 Tax=Streptomyces sp. NPDC056227 TaxID=3345753 RepID=UPI0035E17B35